MQAFDHEDEEGEIRLRLESRLSECGRLHQAIDDFGQVHGIEARQLSRIHLALEEHFSNVVSYGYRDEEVHEIDIRIRCENATVAITIKDDGIAFNPLEFPVPDTTLPIEERPIGGLGIHMMRRSMDDISYQRESGHNVLRITKRL